MQQIASLDLASLERFQTELIQAGFEPDAEDFTSWTGPIAQSLRSLTSSESMRISFRDGWPFQHPRLFVAGLDQRHVNAEGDVCLWASGADSGEWLTWDGYLARIDEWARRAVDGFCPEDFALDAHLAFGRVTPEAIATVDLSQLCLGTDARRRCAVSGTWDSKEHRVLKIVGGLGGAIEGQCYWVGGNPIPPQDLDGVRALLDIRQVRNFDRRYANVKAGQPRLFVVAWERESGVEILVLLAERRGDEIEASAIEVASTDPVILKLRAGPDADVLDSQHVVVMGVGAVGSHVALLLAEAGIGRLTLVDRSLLRPGHVVRHAAGSWAVGQRKVRATSAEIGFKAPWTNVATKPVSPWSPDEIVPLMDDADLVVEATGLASFSKMLSLMSEASEKRLISVALYRGGSVGRVRRQALPDDEAIALRAGNPNRPTIPLGEEPASFEPGCSAPVNNASPIAVSSIAALTAMVAVDLLVGHHVFGDEVIDVYRALSEAPFDVVGRVTPPC